MSERIGPIRKIMPYKIYEIDAVEGWLDEQAQQGLRICSVKGSEFTFERAKSSGFTRYRLDIKPRKESPEAAAERQETYQALGWQYVGSMDKYLDVYQAIQGSAVEINTDETLLNETLARYLRRNLLLIALVLFSTVLLLILVRWGLNAYNRYAYGEPLEVNGGPDVISLGFLALAAGYAICELVFFLQAKRRILLHRDYHTARRSRERMILRWALWGLYAALTLARLLIL